MAKTQPRYDLNHRPASYWEHTDPLQAILAGISGRARREMITDYWNAGKIDELEPELLQDELSAREREGLGRIHPFFMGGEYLPPRLPGEVTIVTIQLESTTFDVIELRARPLPDGKIGLRWVDEYDTEFEAPGTSIDQPFSFAELTAFIEATDLGLDENLPVAYTAMNCSCGASCRADVEGLRNFSTFSSAFYPELGAWAQGCIDAWLEAFVESELGAEAEEEDA